MRAQPNLENTDGHHCTGCICHSAHEPREKSPNGSDRKFMIQNAGSPKGTHGRGRWNRNRKNSNGKCSDCSDPSSSCGSSANSQNDVKSQGEKSRVWVPKFKLDNNYRRGRLNNDWRGNRQTSPSPRSSRYKNQSNGDDRKKVESGPILDPNSPDYANASCARLPPDRQALMKQRICFAFYENEGVCHRGIQCPYVHSLFENGELVSYEHLKVGVNGTHKRFVKPETKETYAPGSQNVICHTFRLKQWCAHGDKCWNKHVSPEEMDKMTKKELEDIKKLDEQLKQAKARNGSSAGAGPKAGTDLNGGVAPTTGTTAAPSSAAQALGAALAAIASSVPSAVPEKQTNGTKQTKGSSRDHPAHKSNNWRFKEDPNVSDGSAQQSRRSSTDDQQSQGSSTDDQQSQRSSTDDADSSSNSGGGVRLGRAITKPHVVQFNLQLGGRRTEGSLN